MNGRGFPTGQANIGLLKALYRTLSTEQSAAAADAWLRSIRMMRADFAATKQPACPITTASAT